MYGRKLNGDKLDPNIDFYDSIENRSKLSIQKLPSIHVPKDDLGHYKIKNSQRARVLSTEFQNLKAYEEQKKLKQILIPKKENPSVQMKNESVKSENGYFIPKEKVGGDTHLIISKLRAGKAGIFTKLGKRISTIGTIGGIFDTSEKEKSKVKRSISLSDTVVNDNDEYTQFLHNNSRVSKYPSYVTVATREEKIVPSPKPLLEVECNETYDVNDNEIVYSKDNQLYINFPNESTSSLVSKLLNTYSQFHLDDNNDELLNTCPETIRNSMNSYSGSSKITAETDDLFSYVEGESFDSEKPSSVMNDSSSQLNIEIPLTTKCYNKKLPALPTPTTPISGKSINQFYLRDYNDNSNPKIIDDSIPPKLPQHKTIPKYLLNTPETVYYDCCEAFSSSTKSLSEISLSSVTSIEPTVKRLVEIPKDTSIFTRKSRKSSGSIQKWENSNDNDNENDHERRRSASFQYLKNAGIDPFMLTGYQENTQLKVINL